MCKEIDSNLETFNKLFRSSGNTIQIIDADSSTPDRYIFKCDKCNLEWEATYSVNLKCPKYTSHVKRLTEEEAHARLSGRSIVMLKWGGGTIKKATFKCKVCENIWETAYSDVENKGKGCRKCTKTFTYPKEFYQEKLIPLNISIVEWGGRTHKKSKFECLTCNNTWATKYNNIQSGTRCPYCNPRGGFNPKKPAYLYVLLLSTPIGDCYGFGITNNYRNRMYFHKSNLKMYIEQEYPLRYFESGSDAKTLESLWKQSPYKVNIGIPGFKTECVLVNPETTRMIFS